MIVCIRRVLAQTTRVARALEVSVQLPHLHVVAEHRVTFNTPDFKQTDLPPPLRSA